MKHGKIEPKSAHQLENKTD